MVFKVEQASVSAINWIKESKVKFSWASGQYQTAVWFMIINVPIAPYTGKRQDFWREDPV